MAAPTRYTRQYDFQDYQQLHPTSPLPANQVDAEFNAVKISTDEIIDNLSLIQRDDGELANGAVTLRALADEVSLGFRPPAAWATGTEYVEDSTVFVEAKFYRATENHTAGASFATDLSAGKWELIADLTLAVIQGSTSEQVFTLSGGQTVVPVTYSGIVEVFLNGLKLVGGGVDFTADNGTTVVLASGATGGDILAVRVFDSFDVANTYTQTQADAIFARKDGATFSGAVQVNATLGVTGVVSFTSTSHMQMPAGTTAQRPVVPAAGMARYNATLTRTEMYENAAWRAKANVDGETFTGTTTIATLSVSGNGTITGTFGVTGVLSMGSTSHFVPATGTAAQRPGGPSEGHSRFSTTLHLPEWYDGTKWRQSQWRRTKRGDIDGFRVSNDSGDLTNDIGVSAGLCASSDDTVDIRLASSLIKRLDATWVAGTNQGMRSSASLADGTWFIFAIFDPSTDTTDIFAHNAVDPTSVLPSGYTKYRMIFAIMRSTSIRKFIHRGDYVQHDTPIDETVGSAFSTTQTNYALTVPIGIEVEADINVLAASSGNYASFVTGHPSSTLTTPTTSGATPTNATTAMGTATSTYAQARHRCLTNSSGEIAIKANATTTSGGHKISTFGFWWRRGKD